MSNKKNKKIKKFINGIQSITSSLELNQLLQKIVENTLELFPGGDACYIQIYDRKTKTLNVRAHIGFQEEVRSFSTREGESITGKVFETGQTKMYFSPDAIARDMTDLSKENFKNITESLEQPELAKMLVCTPITIGEDRIGVLTVLSFQLLEVTDFDVLVFEGFAAQIAVAIHNARLYRKERESKSALEEISEELKEKNEFLMKGIQVHDAFSQLSLQNKGEKSIFLELENMLGLPVKFYNYASEKEYDGNKKTFTQLQLSDVVELFNQTLKPKTIEGNEEEHFYLYPLINKNNFIGCLIINDTKQTLSRMDHIIIEQAASVLTLEIVKKQVLTDVYYKKTHDFFNNLLANKDEEQLKTQSKAYGIDLNKHLMAVAIEIGSVEELEQLEYTVHRLINRLKMSLQIFDHIAFGFHNTVTVLLAAKEQESRNEIFKIINELILGTIKKESVHVVAGMGFMYEGVDHVADSFSEAKKAMSYARKTNKQGLIKYDDIGIDQLFMHQTPEEINQFLYDTLAPLQSDTAENSDLKNTLYTYLENDKAPGRTAQNLHIHVNTLYQRLGKVEQLLNVSFDNVQDTLRLQLAYHIEKTFLN